MSTENQQLPIFEGYTFPKHPLAFAGQLSLDPAKAQDRELIDALTIGSEFTLTIVGRVTGQKYSLKNTDNEAMKILMIDHIVRSGDTITIDE